MNVALINPDTGIIENVIVCTSLEHAKALYPAHTCQERKTELFEPGGAVVGSVVLRADDVTATKVAVLAPSAIKSKLTVIAASRDAAKLQGN